MKLFRVVVNDTEYKVAIEELADDSVQAPRATQAAATVAQPSQQPKATATPPKKPAPQADSSAAGGTIVAPMPGTILQVSVNVGDKVSQGQTLLVLEAMKMENEIMAPADGTVTELNVTQGVSVNAGETLIVLT